ncbi:MAG: hypothetical protein KAJ78_08515, partial [Acidobacteria bacterium]|nr:hypothetical protein [Acidobacteriota bacterium]
TIFLSNVPLGTENLPINQMNINCIGQVGLKKEKNLFKSVAGWVLFSYFCGDGRSLVDKEGCEA